MFQEETREGSKWQITQYDLLISCPGDIQSEVDIIKRVVEDFNERYSDTLGIFYEQGIGRKVLMLSLEENLKHC